MSSLTTPITLIRPSQNHLTLEDGHLIFCQVFFTKWLHNKREASVDLLTTLSDYKKDLSPSMRFMAYLSFWTIFYSELEKRFDGLSDRQNLIAFLVDSCVNWPNKAACLIQMALIMKVKEALEKGDSTSPSYMNNLLLFWNQQWDEICQQLSSLSNPLSEKGLQVWLIAEIERFRKNRGVPGQSFLEELTPWKLLNLNPPVASILQRLITGASVNENEAGYGYAKSFCSIIFDYYHFVQHQFPKRAKLDIHLYAAWLSAKRREILDSAPSAPELTLPKSAGHQTLNNEITKRQKTSSAISNTNPTPINLALPSSEKPKINPFTFLLKNKISEATKLFESFKSDPSDELLKKFNQFVKEYRIKFDNASSQAEYMAIFDTSLVSTFIAYLFALNTRRKFYVEALTQLRFFPEGWLIYCEYYELWKERRCKKMVLDWIKTQGWEGIPFEKQKETALMSWVLSNRANWENLSLVERAHEIQKKCKIVSSYIKPTNLFTATPQAFGACCSEKEICTIIDHMPILYGLAYYLQPNNPFLVEAPPFYPILALVSIQEYQKKLKQRGWNDIADFCQILWQKL